MSAPDDFQAELASAIDREDLARLAALLEADPTLHAAPIGYGGCGPLTRVAECRVPWGPPSATRLAMATWLLDHGSDVHQGGDAPLLRAALYGHRAPMMALLVARGADVNARYQGRYPLLFAPCETLEPDALAWLLENGADPHQGRPGEAAGALDELLATYLRQPAPLARCIELLMDAGAVSRHPPIILDLLRGRLALVEARLESEPDLVHHRFRDLDIGATAYRRFDLRGATLLHLAAEFGLLEAAALLVRRGAAIDALADPGPGWPGLQTPLFHAASQFDDLGLEMASWLLENGADPDRRALLPGHYERPAELVDTTPLGYAEEFPGTGRRTLELLRSRSRGG